MAMTHVILKEFYVDQSVEYFISYAKSYTDLPFAVILDPHGATYTAGRFLRASDLGIETNNAGWKTVLFDTISGRFCVPNGSIGFRWNEEGRWNLKLEADGKPVDPLLSYASNADSWVKVSFPLFDFDGGRIRHGTVPVKRIETSSGEVRVA